VTDRPESGASLPGPADPRRELRRVRLNRYLALAGVASRRAADRLIAQRRVRVNGAVVEELGILVLPERDQVEVDDIPVGPVEVPRYFILHKPRGVVTTAADPQGRPTVLDLVAGRAGVARVFPVGRLDLDSEGVLLLTNDGTLAHRLLHPRYHVPKVYAVWTQPPPRPADLEQLQAGVEIEPGVRTQPARVAMVPADTPRGGGGWGAPGFEIEIREGKKRQVRRMCEALGLTVTRLVRVRFGPLALGQLPAGELRALSLEEVRELELAAGLPHRKRGFPQNPQTAGDRG
jgi:pseudouridine synthase